MLDILKSFAAVESPLFILVEMNIIIASLGIILLPRIIYAALCLAFVFINIALLYLLLNAEFLAAAQVLIYVGAINVLIVFAIMLVNPPSFDKDSSNKLGQKLSALFLFTLFSILILITTQTPFALDDLFYHAPLKSVQDIGTTLLQNFLIPFELLSLLLLVALVGAITIAGKQIVSK